MNIIQPGEVLSDQFTCNGILRAHYRNGMERPAFRELGQTMRFEIGFRVTGIVPLLAYLAVLSALWCPVCALKAEALPGHTSSQTWDTMSDTWAATDALGRVLPTASQAGSPRSDRWVGVFYFLWHGPHVNGGPYNNSEILRQDPDAMRKPTSPPWGPMGAMHHWGESQFGYYLADDAYVLRRHAQMLADAGVDFIVFDVTNQATYRSYYMALLKVFAEIRASGGKTPQVAFLTPFGDPRRVVTELYADLYRPGLYSDLWFRWDGKPLILADPLLIGETEGTEAHDGAVRLRDFFTFRKPQPDYFIGPTRPDMWSWLEIFPQHVFRNSRGEKEQMSVGVAQNAVDGRLGSLSEARARSRNWHNGANDTRPGAVNEGLNFSEQFEHALKEDPRVIFITGWNEWIASRFDQFAGSREPVMFVDEFNQERSRDIEPMKGGHEDNYYYQMVSFIRRYKGVHTPPPASGPVRIAINGDFGHWAAVLPEYRDDVGDAAHRDHPGWNNAAHYVNDTGRNDFVAAKVARDARNLYFYVRTKDPITSNSGTNWMWLLLNVNGAAGTNWHGYNFVVNRTAAGVLEASAGGWNWRRAGTVRYKVKGCEMELAIRRADLGLRDASQPLHIEFKWADNMQHPGEIEEFAINGDVAPNGRFNYVYSVPGL